jgi:hypothetical protein
MRSPSSALSADKSASVKLGEPGDRFLRGKDDERYALEGEVPLRCEGNTLVGRRGDGFEPWYAFTG